VGYDFIGWYADSALSKAWQFGTDTMPASNLTLYAKWQMIIDTDLSALSVTGYALNEIFSPAVTQYTVSGVVENTIDVLAVVREDQFSTVSVNGTQMTTSAAITVGLVNGANTIDIVVTAQDDKTQKHYTLVVNKLSDVANLAVFDAIGYEMTPNFEALTTSYSVHMTTGSQLLVQIMPADDGSVNLSGYQFTTGSNVQFTTGSALKVKTAATLYIDAPIGSSTYDFTVTALNGIDQKTYTLIVYRDNNDATLKQLTVESQTLTPSFDPLTTSYTLIETKNTVIEVTPALGSSQNATMTINGVTAASGTAVTVPLSIGTNTIKIVVTAEDGVTTKTYTFTVNRLERTTTSSSTSTPTTTTPTTSAVNVIVNGQTQNAGTETVASEGSKTVVTIDVNSNTITNKINEIVAAQTQNPEQATENVVVVPVANHTASKVNANLTGDIIKNMENNQFKLTVQTNNVDYILPAKEVQISNVAKSLAVNEADLKDITISVTIDKLEGTASDTIIKEAADQSLQVVFPPVAFKVEATATTSTGEKRTVEISKFSGYVERRIALPEGIDPTKITTGVVYNEDGTFSHIPTRVVLIDGIYYAELSSVTNSSYSVVYHPVEVSSVDGHWSEEAVDNMASRLVIIDTENFSPDAAITRGEFIDYIVRAMGLYRNGAADMSLYPDMSPAYADSVTIAKTYGIANGYEDGTIRDTATLTREEAMVMLAQALDAFSMLNASDEMDANAFTDEALVSTWASADAARIVNAAIMNGVGNQQLDPKGQYTCAQAAATIENMLMRVELINN
jgi:uncharacterized repeat protein (TIGR02543 family)